MLEAEKSLPSAAGVKNQWSCNSTPIYAFMACVGKTLRYCSTFGKHNILRKKRERERVLITHKSISCFIYCPLWRMFSKTENTILNTLFLRIIFLAGFHYIKVAHNYSSSHICNGCCFQNVHFVSSYKVRNSFMS